VEAPVVGRTFIPGVLCIDSISLGNSEDAGLVVASGSHGGVTAAGMTRLFRPRFAFFNDAGFGVDRAGAACLPILDSEGMAAATVAADSACIGDGESTLTQGIISAVNETAYRLGARVGETALKVAVTVAERALNSPRAEQADSQRRRKQNVFIEKQDRRPHGGQQRHRPRDRQEVR
jgi:hypothetical protein